MATELVEVAAVTEEAEGAADAVEADVAVEADAGYKRKEL